MIMSDVFSMFEENCDSSFSINGSYLYNFDSGVNLIISYNDSKGLASTRDIDVSSVMFISVLNVTYQVFFYDAEGFFISSFVTSGDFRVITKFAFSNTLDLIISSDVFDNTCKVFEDKCNFDYYDIIKHNIF